MSAIDPNLESNPNAPGAEQERLMLRHDLRGALQGVLDGIRRLGAADLAPDLREQAERVTQSAQSLSALLDRLLGDAGGAEAEPEPVEIDHFLDALRHRHAGAARERGLLLSVQAGGGLPDRLRLDPVSLSRVLDNLLVHAMKSAPSGAVRVAASRAQDGAMLFCVGDGGRALPSEAIDQAFRAGISPAPEAAETIGLQIVRSLTERMSGEIACVPHPGAGCDVILRFPPAVAVDRVRSPGVPLAGPDLGGIRILLAEDNLTNQIVASQMLRSLNAEVTICADGVEALERFDAVDPDLVVVDIEMPRLSGLDVIRAIRARDDARAQVPIVALTAYAMREHRERIAAAGADGLISKPITSIEALGRGLAAHIARRQPAQPEPPAAPAEGSGPVIDMPTFDALCQAIGPEMMAELLDKVISDLVSAQAQMSAALPELDRAVIRSTSHILISVAGALGAVRLQACARTLNGSAQGEATEVVAGGVRRCIAEIDSAVAFARARHAAGGGRP